MRSSLMVPAMDDNSYAFLNLISILVAYSQSMHAHGFGPLKSGTQVKVWPEWHTRKVLLLCRNMHASLPFFEWLFRADCVSAPMGARYGLAHL